MARKAFTDHPDFLVASRIASDAVESAMKSFRCATAPEHTSKFDVRLNTIADDLTRLLLAMDAEVAKERKQEAA